MLDAPTPRIAQRARELIESGTIAVVPDLWYYEVCSALMMAERQGRASAQVVSSHVQDIENLAAFLEVSPTTPSALIAAARQSGLAVYDAAYFGLALLHNLPLATLDGKLGAAAQKAGVALLR
jgi:predicted nucleic acid-binding protein